MNRETKTITAPKSGSTLVLNAYITGRERRALTNVYLQGGLKFDLDGSHVNGLDASLVDKVQDLAWKTVIVSFNGHKDGDLVDNAPFSIVEAILDLRDEDTQFIIKEVNDITSDKKFEQKNSIEYDYRTYLNGSNNHLSDELRIALVCERMHWTYEEYLKQPDWFIKVLFLKWGVDSDKAKEDSKK